MNAKKTVSALALITLAASCLQAQNNPTITCTYEQHQVYDVEEPRDVEEIVHENVEDFDWSPGNPHDAKTQNNAKGFCELPEIKDDMFPEDKNPDDYVLTSINLETQDETGDNEDYEFAPEDIQTPQHMRAFVYEGPQEE